MKTLQNNLLFFILLCFLPCIFSYCAQAQGETANWYFGQNAALHFNPDGSVSSLTGSAMNTPLGCATISDMNGNLLFYTNGETIWNRQHQVMVNGSSLLGSKVVTQSCIIIPQNTRLYYVFYLERYNGRGNLINLRYSIVDMAAQNGLGEVMASAKNMLLYGIPPSAYSYFSQKLTAVHHTNGKDIWLVAHRFFNLAPNLQEYLSFKIDFAQAFISAPVINQLHNPNGLPGTYSLGGLKASPDGRWLIAVYGDNPNTTALFRFNNKTGILKKTINFKTCYSTLSFLGTEFSPDGSKLYSSRYDTLVQFDLSSRDSLTILNTYKKIGITSLDAAGGAQPVNTMQVAGNGKIYMLVNLSNGSVSSQLYEIANPNVSGSACDLKLGPVLAPGNYTESALPNFIQSYFAPPRFTFSPTCSRNPMQFTIPNLQDVDSVKWDFGDAASGNLNYSRAKQPGHIYATSGNYTVKLTVFMLGEAPVFERTVTVNASPQASLGQDLTLCENSEVILTNKASPKQATEKYCWSTGDTILSLPVKTAGMYWLEVRNELCTVRDSVKVTFKTCLPPYIPNIITQNHDGKNDTFQPQNLPEGNWQLQVYNRWGNKIYVSENYQNNWPKSKTSSGVYYYLLKNRESGKQFKGWLEVVE